MIVLPLIGYLGWALGFCFLTLSIASGLYYLSELVEEHTVLASRLLRRLIYTISALQILLWLVDGLPFHWVALSVISHLVYASNLRHFPVVKLKDPLFILSCVLVLVNHLVWFEHFSKPEPRTWSEQYNRKTLAKNRPWGSQSSTIDQPSFSEIASYFGICVWLVPFALFISLSAGDNVLPSMGSEYATGRRDEGMAGPRRKRRNTGMAKAAVGNVKEWVSDTGAVVGLWQGENVRRFE